MKSVIARKVTEIYKPTRVFNVGCGDNYSIRCFRQVGIEGIGIDMDKSFDFAINSIKEVMK